MAICWSAPERTYSGDVQYEYRQASSFLYLTGIDQRNEILFMFMREPDARREHWQDTRSGRTKPPRRAASAP